MFFHEKTGTTYEAIRSDGREKRKRESFFSD